MSLYCGMIFLMPQMLIMHLFSDSSADTANHNKPINVKTGSSGYNKSASKTCLPLSSSVFIRSVEVLSTSFCKWNLAFVEFFLVKVYKVRFSGNVNCVIAELTVFWRWMETIAFMHWLTSLLPRYGIWMKTLIHSVSVFYH